MIAVIDYGTGNIRSVENALKRLGARLCEDASALGRNLPGASDAASECRATGAANAGAAFSGPEFCVTGDANAGSAFSAPEFCVTDDAEVIRRADHVILPGVGEAARAMEQLRLKGLDEVISSLTCPVLGICIGMQLMCRHSEEGNVSCLGIFPADVVRLPSSVPGCSASKQDPVLSKAGLSELSEATSKVTIGDPDVEVEALKIPHVGWNTVQPVNVSETSPQLEVSDGKVLSVNGLVDNLQTSGTGCVSPLFRGLGAETYFYFVHSYAAQICPTTAAVTEYGVHFSAAMAQDNFFGTQFHPEKSGSAGRALLRNFLEL